MSELMKHLTEHELYLVIAGQSEYESNLALLEVDRRSGLPLEEIKALTQPKTLVAPGDDSIGFVWD